MPVWVRLSVGGAATLLVGMGLGRFSYAPLIPALIENGGLSAAEAGSVAAFNLAGFLIGALAAPWLRRPMGETALLRACLWITLVCLVASIAPGGAAWLAFWRCLVGITMGVMMVYALAIVTRHAPPGRLGAATGIVFTGVGVAILASGVLVPLLLRHGLVAAWSGLAVFGAAGVAVALWGWRAAGPAESAANGGPPPRFRPSPAAFRLIAAQSLFGIGLLPHSIYWVDYLVRGLGRSIDFGGFHWVLFGLGAMTGTFLWGRLADRIGHRMCLILVLASLAAGVALPVILPAVWALVLSSLVVGAQPGFSAIVSGRVHQIVGPDEMAPLWRAMALVGGVAQAIGGYLLVALFEITGSYVPIFLIGGAAMGAGAIVAIDLKAGPSPPAAGA